MKKRILAALLTLTLLLACFGCTSAPATKAPADTAGTSAAAGETATPEVTEPAKTAAQIEIETPAALVGYVPGDLPGDLPLVMEKVAPILKEKINATVEWHGVSWGDLPTKYPLILASGEQCDLMFTADWNFLKEFVTKNALLELDDLIPEYCPAVLEMDQDFVNSGRIKGKLYLIPSNFPSFNTDGYIVRGDMMKKYNIPDIKSYKDYFNYLRAIKPDFAVPFDSTVDASLIFSFQQENRDRIVQTTMDGYVFINADGTVTYAFDDPAFMEFLSETRKAYNEGLWSKSVLSNQTIAKDAFDNGKTGGFIWNVWNGDNARTASIQNGFDWDVRFYEAGADLPYEILPATAGISVPFASKNAKRALLFLNEVNANFELWSLLTNGIEGTHYVINDKNEKVLPEGMTASENLYPTGGWAFCWGTNVTKYHYTYGDPFRTQTLMDIVDKAMNKGRMNSISKYGFTIDSENLKTEETAVYAAVAKYFTPLVWGTLELEDGIAACKEKLNAAGVETCRAEYERQIKEFMATNNLKTLFD